jgi:hypothetical protein
MGLSKREGVMKVSYQRQNTAVLKESEIYTLKHLEGVFKE